MMSILDYGSGNIDAFVNLCKESRIEYKIINEWRQVERSDKLLFPGVGAFDPTINRIRELGLFDAIRNLAIHRQRPVLGVCVGMQCLLDGSEEGALNGLSLIRGNCAKFDQLRISTKPKIPHMGWNSVSKFKENTLLRDVDLNKGFYFLHSYHATNINPSNIICTSFHGYDFPCIVHENYTIGVQFHPEKSHINGTILLRNFNEL